MIAYSEIDISNVEGSYGNPWSYPGTTGTNAPVEVARVVVTVGAAVGARVNNAAQRLVLARTVVANHFIVVTNWLIIVTSCELE